MKIDFRDIKPIDGSRKSIFNIGKLRWLSLSKPPSSLAFSYGRFDASTSSATTGSMTVSTGTSNDFI